jgi:hypothetical protein
MKGFQKRAVTYLSASVREKEKEERERAAAEAAKKKAEAAAAPKGNRKERRAHSRFNKLLNRKLNKTLNKANALGQGVSVSVGKDGGVNVRVSKSGLTGEPVANKDTTDVVRGEELEARLEELAK